MNAASHIVNMLDSAARHPHFAWLLEMALKSTALLLLALGLGLLLRSASAARRHLLWCLSILTLGGLPIFISFGPEFTLAVPMVAVAGNAALEPAVSQWTSVLLRVYLVGVVLLLLHLGSGVARLIIVARQARRCEHAMAQRLLAGILDSELMSRSVDLRVHPALNSPLSWGLLRPMIILPASSAAWSTARMRHVLLHEMGHIRRLDWVTQLVGGYAVALCWYNPLAWYAARNMNELAEQACDDAVLLNDCSHTAYASDLVALAKALTPRSKASHLMQALANSFLGSRVLAILDTARLRTHNDSVWVLRAMLLAFTSVALLGALKLGPPAVLSELGSSLGRYITVNLLPAPAAPGIRDTIVLHPLPQRVSALPLLPDDDADLRPRPDAAPGPGFDQSALDPIRQYRLERAQINDSAF